MERTPVFDRPYAGFFLGFFKRSFPLPLHEIFGNLDSSGHPGDLGLELKKYRVFSIQRFAEDSRIATWEEQLATSFHNNLYVSYVHEWQWQPNPYSVHFALKSEHGLPEAGTFMYKTMWSFILVNETPDELYRL